MFQLIKFGLELMRSSPVAAALVLWLRLTLTVIGKFVVEILIADMSTEYCTSGVSVATLCGNPGRLWLLWTPAESINCGLKPMAVYR